MAKNLEISFLLDFYGEMLTQKQREVIEYYYNDDLSLAEIADNEGITRQGCATQSSALRRSCSKWRSVLAWPAGSVRCRRGSNRSHAPRRRSLPATKSFAYSRDIYERAVLIRDTASRLNQ